jgi:hypothetical protein
MSRGDGRATAPDGWGPRRLPDSCLARFVDDYYIDPEPADGVKRAIRDELTRRYYEQSEARRRADNRRWFWGSTAGVRWHEDRRRWYQDPRRFREGYLRARGLILGQIDWLLGHIPGFTDLCEIGTGNGLMIDYLASRLPQIEHFRGIDLSAEQVARNRAIYGASKVEFLHVEAADYVTRHCRPGTLFVAYGTFECFTQAELEELFALTRRSVDRVAFASCDVVAVDYDAEVERDSRPRGDLLYSHNYRHLLETHGFETRFCQVEAPKPIYNRLTLLATSVSGRDLQSP